MNAKVVMIVILCLWFMLSSCDRTDHISVAPGVSRELAIQRKAEIKNLSYQLEFCIPEKRSEPVGGRVKILFTLDQSRDVVLDFREQAEKVKKLVVNDCSVMVRLLNEHLIIPEAWVCRGENVIEIDFITGDQSLNRNEDYLYTLLVPDRARTLFPCFDQPDLKARFSLVLRIPSGWTAVANGLSLEESEEDGQQKIIFTETEPLSTYLFSFVAGKWDRLEETRRGRTVSLYHRETDSARLAQVSTIFDQVYASLEWMEDYTGIPYPFAKYDLIILPGFQFGGMEHAGATLYNDKRIFLNDHPTVAEELGRMELIAHETAHMWFGDYVTMEWFNDVWTKEVFANYFAAQMIEPQFPQINHRLNALRNFFVPAYSEDRTKGSNAIRQPLENLNSAGLIYGLILYDKAPVVMEMLVDLMGKENFRKGIQEYLQTYAYSNANWDGLVRILDHYSPKDLASWSRMWIDEKGMPGISAIVRGNQLEIRQQDPFGRGFVWPQKIRYMLLTGDTKGRAGFSVSYTDVWLKDSVMLWPVGDRVDFALPNADGKSYGYFMMDRRTVDFCLQHLSDFSDPVERLSLLMTLYENYLHDRVEPQRLANVLLKQLEKEIDPLVITVTMGYVKEVCQSGSIGKFPGMEMALLDLARHGKGPGCRQAAFRTLMEVSAEPEVTEVIYGVWDTQQPWEGIMLGDNDYMKMAYELAVRFPDRYPDIVDRQGKRLANPDRQREFLYISQAVNPDTLRRDSLFQSLLEPANRRFEPWVGQIMYYLNHPLRQEQALRYIRPALGELQEVQRTGDIFFPKDWVSGCLRGHHSPAAAGIVNQFLQQHPDYPPLLKNKLLQSADHLLSRQQ